MSTLPEDYDEQMAKVHEYLRKVGAAYADQIRQATGVPAETHESREHKRCTECGRAPRAGFEATTHKPDCPRLQPGYAYPGPVPAEYEESSDDDDG
jgi:hypothetical protein